MCRCQIGVNSDNFFPKMHKVYEELIKKHPQTKQNVTLADFTTIKIGGQADLFYELNDIEQLPQLLTTASTLQIPVFIFGGGSNLIFNENGFRGLVIKIAANKIVIENQTITADAGALLSQVIQTAIKNNLTGLEKLTGLPGTIGGAARGNAGAFGTEIKDVLTSATIYNEKKGIHEVDKNYFDFDYRSSKIKQNKGRDIILQVKLTLKKSEDHETQKAQTEIVEILKSRTGKQPSGKTTGSFFKNPNPELAAGYLLDQCGCKGLQVGGVQVSHQHANWLINLGNATQEDVIELAHIMRERVEDRFDIRLEPEVQFVSITGYLDIA